MLSPEGEQIVAQAQRILVEVNALTAMSEQLRDPMGAVRRALLCQKFLRRWRKNSNCIFN